MIVLILLLVIIGLSVIKILNINHEETIIDELFVAIGLGLGMFILLSIIFSLLNLPIQWIIFTCPILLIFLSLKKYRFPKIKLDRKNVYSIIILLLFIFNFAVFTFGAFRYPWLENGDPWHHATVTRYISQEGTMLEQAGEPDLLKYADPYPSSYDAIMSMVYSRNKDIIKTLKLCNVLLIALCIPFAYLFFKRLFNSMPKAAFSSFILAMLPCFLSHFIWSVTLAVCLFFITMYTLERTEDDKKWVLPAAIMIGALLVSQPSMSLKLGIMIGLYIFSKMIIHRSFKRYLLIAGILGIGLSMLWWGTAFIRWGNPVTNGWNGIYNIYGNSETGKHLAANPGWFRNRGTADRKYNIEDFFFVKIPNMINNPIGLGFFMCCFVLFSLGYIIFDFRNLVKKGEEWRLISISWLCFTFLGIHGERLPIQFIAFRFWMLFAIACSVLVGATLFTIIDKYKVSKYAIIGLVLVAVVVTSGIPKFRINTSVWPSGGLWSNQGEMTDYFLLSKYVKKNSRIYPFCIYGTDKLISLGYDTCAWCKDEHEFRYSFINRSIDEIYDFLVSKHYDYFTIDGRCVSWYSVNETNRITDLMIHSDKFQLLNNPKGMMLFLVK